MRPARSISELWLCCAAVVLALLGAAPAARAVCNVIPAATQEFRSGLGSANRPFASPHDYVEVRVRPAPCWGNSTGYVDLNGNGRVEDDYVVTVLFVPPAPGDKNAVVLAEDCTGLDLGACDAQLGGGGATCVTVNGAGDPVGLRVENQHEIQFRFPDTDGRLEELNDELTYVGPAKIVVTRRTKPLRCDLAGQRCAEVTGETPTTGVVACVDELYELDGTCRTASQYRDELFSHFTALPPPNNLQAMIEEPALTDVRLTIDEAGNLLIPMDYSGVLLRVEDVPIPMMVRGKTTVDAFAGVSQAVDLPGDGFISSYSPEGVLLPPVFTPLHDPDDADAATLFGSVDAVRGVIRVAKKGCRNGQDEGAPCEDDGDCEDTCSDDLFDFSDRFVADVGPVLLEGVTGGGGGSGGEYEVLLGGGSAAGEYQALLEMPVPIEGLVESEEAFSFVVSERLDGVDRNNDGDILDFVVTLRDRESGRLQAIGAAGGAQGRAVPSLREPPFAFPAVETEGDLVAFLESEPLQFYQDTNSNGNVFDTVLRVFQLGATSATELTDPNDPLTADGALLLDERGLAVSDGLVFFRTPEAAQARQETTRVSVDSAGNEADSGGVGPAKFAAGGRMVEFESSSTNLVPGDDNGVGDIFVHDRSTGAITRVSVTSTGAQADDNCSRPDISGDGRFVAFTSTATNLDPNDPDGRQDVYVHDRDLDTDGIFDEPNAISTTLMSVNSAASPEDDYSSAPAIAGSGRFVTFATERIDPNYPWIRLDVYVHDRDLDEDGIFDEPNATSIKLVTVGLMGAPAEGSSALQDISADERFITFSSSAENLVEGDTNSWDDVFIHDLREGVTTLVSLDSAGNQGNYNSENSGGISADGRHVVFGSQASNLVPGDTNNWPDVFVHDRLTGQTTRVNVSSTGEPAIPNLYTEPSDISADGRLVVIGIDSPNLVPGDSNDVKDIFLHDRLTGATMRVNVDSMGAQANDRSDEPAISADGRLVSFISEATNLVVGDTNGFWDVFVRGPDPNDVGADLTGDNDLDDVVLRVLDTTAGPPSIATLCPATSVAVAEGRAAFLRPESAGASAEPSCTGGDLTGPALNADGDEEDEVVHLFSGGTVQNLHCAATDVALSDTQLAALVSEADQGDGSLNGDSDTNDLVVKVRSVAASDPNSCSHGSWINVAQAADTVDVVGDVVAMITPEADQGDSPVPLNGDGDTDDRVVRLVDATTGSLIQIKDDQGLPTSPQAAEEFVLSEHLLAFRTPEAAQGEDLNADSDFNDRVLQVYNVQTGELINSGQAAIPCRLVACDPRTPYRVSEYTVRFLTLESQQNEDLNDDGDQDDLLVQVFNVRSGETEVAGEVVDNEATVQHGTPTGDPLSEPTQQEEEGGDQAFVSRGRCVEDTGGSCTAEGDCDPGQFCLVDPGPTGTCALEHGTCVPGATDPGCPPGSTCRDDLVMLTLKDVDGDEIPDPLDNCPKAANVEQLDRDLDGVGDACDLQTCGKGGTQLDEECDDGSQCDDGTDCTGDASFCALIGTGLCAPRDGDGVMDTCDSNCTTTACGNGILTVGEACDDGNLIDGDGCQSDCTVAPLDILAQCSGKRLLIRDKAGLDGDLKRKIVVLSKDPLQIPAPPSRRSKRVRRSRSGTTRRSQPVTHRPGRFPPARSTRSPSGAGRGSGRSRGRDRISIRRATSTSIGSRPTVRARWCSSSRGSS